MVERFRVAFDRVFGRGVQRPVRHRQEAEHRADVDDAPTSSASHVGHDSPCHPNHPKEVRIEDRPGLLHRAFFGSRRGDAEARIVHEQVDATF